MQVERECFSSWHQGPSCRVGRASLAFAMLDTLVEAAKILNTKRLILMAAEPMPFNGKGKNRARFPSGESRFF